MSSFFDVLGDYTGRIVDRAVEYGLEKELQYWARFTLTGEYVWMEQTNLSYQAQKKHILADQKPDVIRRRKNLASGDQAGIRGCGAIRAII